MKRGEVYLADLNRKSEHNIAKVRPVVVFQNDFLIIIRVHICPGPIWCSQSENECSNEYAYRELHRTTHFLPP